MDWSVEYLGRGGNHLCALKELGKGIDGKAPKNKEKRRGEKIVIAGYRILFEE